MNFLKIFDRNNKSSGIFIPKKSEFIELTDEISFKSINGITEHLGYHTDQAHGYFETLEKDSGITNIIVEIFSNNIIFVLTKDTVTKLKKSKVDNYMRNFDVNKVFNSYTTESILEYGVENSSLNIDFLSKVLNIEEPEQDGMFYASSIEYYLYFVDGFLVSFQSADGLNEPAKDWKQSLPVFFRDLEKVTKLYWGNNLSSVINEINLQAEAYTKIPFIMKNEFLELHKTKHGTINFVMLLVCHYTYMISFEDFAIINHGRYFKLDTNKYLVDRFIYEFDEFGNLINAYMNV